MSCSPGSSVAGSAPRVARQHRRHARSARVPCPRGDGWAVRRKDDTESAIRRRLDLYDEESRFLVKWFDERGLLLTVDGAASPDTVYDATLAALRPALWGDRLAVG